MRSAIVSELRVEVEFERPLSLSISRLIRRDVKTLISLEDLNRFDESYPEYRLKEFYFALNTDANILIPLYCGQDPMIRQFMRHGLYLFANEWFKNDNFFLYRENLENPYIEHIFRLPIDILRKIDKSVFKIEGALETIGYIFSIHSEWADSVEMINEQVFWSWVEQLPSLLEISPNILQISGAIKFHLIRKQRQKQRHVYRVNGVDLTYYFDDETLN